MIEYIFVGLIISFIFIELTGVYPGGIIVPSYLSFYIDQPLRILGTLLISIICIGIYKILARHVILFGKRRFIAMLFIGGILTILWNRVFLGETLYFFSFLHSIGIMIPGLIANTIEKQGFVITMLSTSVSSILVFAIMQLLFLVF